jgi:hypothetical protein
MSNRVMKALAALSFLTGCVLATFHAGSGQVPVSPPTALTVMVDGVPIGTTTMLNLVSGPGITWVQTASTVAGQLNVQASVNTASIPNKNIVQSGACSVYFATGSNASAFTASGAPQCQVLQALNEGMPFLFVPNGSNAPGATLTIDKFGPYTLMEQDGQTEIPGNSMVSGYGYPMWFDGSVIRLQAQ